MIVGARVIFTGVLVTGDAHTGDEATVITVRAQSAMVRFDDGLTAWTRKDEIEDVK